MAETRRETVSVVIPVHNGAEYLAKALESVFSQTEPAEQVIVVDDGSRDRSAAIARSFPEVRLIQQANAGVSAARNAGVSASTGSLLAFLDQDDLWLPDKLRFQTEYLAKHPEAGYVLCHQRYVVAGERPDWFRPRTDASEPSYVPSAWLVRRQAFEVAGGFADAFRLAQDIEWIARAQDAGIIAGIVQEVLLLKRIHGDNLGSRASEGRREVLQALRASARRKESKRRAGLGD